MEDYIQFSAKTKNEAITKACLELGTSSDQLNIQVISEGSSGFFGIGSKPAIIKVRRIEPVSDMQEIDDLVESVKLDAIKEEKKLDKPSKIIRFYQQKRTQTEIRQLHWQQTPR